VQDAILRRWSPHGRLPRRIWRRVRSELNGQLVQLLSAIDQSTGLPTQVMTVKGKQQAMIIDHPGAAAKHIRRSTVSRSSA